MLIENDKIFHPGTTPEGRQMLLWVFMETLGAMTGSAASAIMARAKTPGFTDVKLTANGVPLDLDEFFAKMARRWNVLLHAAAEELLEKQVRLIGRRLDLLSIATRGLMGAAVEQLERGLRAAGFDVFATFDSGLFSLEEDAQFLQQIKEDLVQAHARAQGVPERTTPEGEQG